MIKRYSQYILEDVSKIDLHYLALDWDDNILHMPTKIHMDHLVNGEWIPEDVSTAKFAEIRGDKENWRLRNNDPTQAFSEFRDTGKRGSKAFLEDTIEAIDKGEFGPSWDAFIEYLSKGTIFSIITARGHEPSSIRTAVEYIIDNVLTDGQKVELYSHCLKFAYLFRTDYDSYDRIPKGQISKTRLIIDYLDNCDFYGVSSQYCINKFNLDASALEPEKAKEMAIKEFTKKIDNFGKKIGANVSLGFSDDDVRNVKHIEKLFRDELALNYAMKYNIYDTSKREIKGGVRTRIKGNLVETQTSFGSGNATWGTDSSILPFTKWNNMTQNLYPSGANSNDDYQNQFRNQLGQLKDLTKIDKKKA